MVNKENKAIQISFFDNSIDANVFMVDVEVVDVKFQHMGVAEDGHWIMVIYKKWVSRD